MTDPDLTTAVLAAAQETAVAAGRLLRDKWEQPRELHTKGFRDLVTDADFAAQRLITDRLQAVFPGHGFITEEEAPTLPHHGPVRWVIDPLDGTSNYSRQIPIFCVSIGAVDQAGNVLAGAVYDPMRDELFSAARGRGAQLNGRSLHVSDTAQISNAICALDWSHNRESRQSVLDTIDQFAPKVHTARAVGSAALALAWVAAGRVDSYLNYNLKPWDIAAGHLLVTEAGGQISNLEGQPWQVDIVNFAGLVSNGRLHSHLLATLHS